MPATGRVENNIEIVMELLASLKKKSPILQDISGKEQSAILDWYNSFFEKNHCQYCESQLCINMPNNNIIG